MGWGKRIVIALIVLVLLVVIAGAIVVVPMLQKPADIQLKVDSGLVEAKTAADYEPVTGTVSLKPGNSVRTKEGAATVVFFGATIMRLDANTEVTIKEANKDEAKIVVGLASGKTWNRVIRAGGNDITGYVGLTGATTYEVDLPTAVATVRGTAFSAEAAGLISVIAGKVGVQKEDVEKEVENATAQIGDQIQITELVKDAWILQNQEKDKSFDTNLLAQLKQKYWLIISWAKSKYGMTDEQIDAAIMDFLSNGGELGDAQDVATVRGEIAQE